MKRSYSPIDGSLVTRIANRDASFYTQKHLPFVGNNLFATKDGEKYTVWSYGYHWPLWIYKDGKWYENNDKYSVTTSKHKTQSHPNTTILNQLSAEEMRTL